MPTWKDFLEQLAVIRAAPIPFALGVIFVGAIIWFIVNFVNQGAMSAKDATIETQKAQIDSYKDKLSGATPAEAKKRIDDLEARLAKFEPRRITEDQRLIIFRSIGTSTDNGHLIAIQCEMSCADCDQYATDIQKILSDSRWETIKTKVMGAGAASAKGIAILTPDPANPLPETVILARALKEAKIPFDLKAGGQPWPPGRSAMIAAMLITAKSSF